MNRSCAGKCNVLLETNNGRRPCCRELSKGGRCDMHQRKEWEIYKNHEKYTLTDNDFQIDQKKIVSFMDSLIDLKLDATQALKQTDDLKNLSEKVLIAERALQYQKYLFEEQKEELEDAKQTKSEYEERYFTNEQTLRGFVDELQEKEQRIIQLEQGQYQEKSRKRGQITQLKLEISNLNKQLADLQTITSEARIQVEDTKKILQERDATIESQRQTLTRLNSEKKSVEKAQNELRILLTKQKREINALQTNVSKKQTAIADLERKNAEERDRNENIVLQNTQEARRELVVVKNKLEVATQTIDQLQSDLNVSSTIISKNKAAYEQQREQDFQQFQSGIAELKEKLLGEFREQLDDEIEKTRQEGKIREGELQTQLNTAKSRTVTLGQELKTAETNLEIAQQGLEQVSEQASQKASRIKRYARDPAGPRKRQARPRVDNTNVPFSFVDDNNNK